MDKTTFLPPFLSYLNEIKKIIGYCKDKEKKEFINERVRQSIERLNFEENEVDANFEYFKDCYDDNQSVDECLINLRLNEDELFRKSKSFTDNTIINEAEERNVVRYCLGSVDTDDLEDAIDGRWDQTFVNPNNLSEDDLWSLLDNSRKSRFTGKVKHDICEILGLNNDFSYSIEEIVEELKKFY